MPFEALAKDGAEFVFTTFEYGGHVTPALATAARLQARGRRVLVVSDEATRAEAEGFGLPFRPWTTAPNRRDKRIENEPLRDWECATPAEAIERLLDRLMTGAAGAYAADTAAVLDANPGAVVVTQELLFGCMLGAEARGARLALHTANIWPLPTLHGVPPFGPGLEPPVSDEDVRFQSLIREASRGFYDIGLPALNAARAEHALAPLARTLDQIDTADLILLSAARAYDFAPPAGLPAPFVYAGPRRACPPGRRRGARPGPRMIPGRWCWCRSRRSTRRRKPVIRRVISALETLPVRGVVTLGPQLDVAAFPTASQNVVVLESASHDALMPRLSAMITHAGHGSAIRPILNGVPLICLPMGRDQPDNAARIAARGAGVRLDPQAPADAIAAAVMRVLADRSFAEAARTWGAAIRAEVEANGDVAVDRLEALAASARAPEREDLVGGEGFEPPTLSV